jgi:hypothetical protein
MEWVAILLLLAIAALLWHQIGVIVQINRSHGALSNARGIIRRELIYNKIFNVMPLRCRHCRSDDFTIRFCESTPRQPGIRIRFGGRGQCDAIALSSL